MYDLSKLPEYSELDFIKSLDILNSHMRNKEHFRINPFEIFDNIVINNKDFSTKNKKQSYYSNCIFKSVNFTEAGFPSSVFIDCKFVDCKFEYSNFQFCDFRNCSFEYINPTEINCIIFTKSLFTNNTFKNIIFKSANFCDCVIFDSTFDDCKFISVATTQTLFQGVIFKRLKFRSQNFDFAIFNNIKMIDSVLPFPTIPFIFNGIKYLQETNDNILITSYDNKNSKMTRITKDEYLSLLDNLEIYYLKVKWYFPLANIYISRNQFKLGMEAILQGIKQAIIVKNFRILTFYCFLIINCRHYDYTDRKNIYYYIIKIINEVELSYIDTTNLNFYINDIKNILLNESNNPCLNISLKTNIEENSYDKLSIFLESLDKLANQFSDDKLSYSITLRHGSPYDISLIINSLNIDTLILYLTGLYIMINSSITAIDKLLNFYNKFLDTKIKKMQYDELKSKKNETKKLNDILEFSHNEKTMLKENNIIIISGNHNIINLNIQCPSDVINNSFENKNNIYL